MKNKDYKGINEAYKLFCFPYAGAGASIYKSWQKATENNICIYSVQLPGRENRYTEDLPSNMEKLVERVYEEIEGELNGNYSFFGHSMGGVLAFALTMFLQNKGIKLPDVVFMSGASVEQKKRKKKITDMDDTELANYLCIHSGTDQKILCSKWYRKYYFPIIRRDYQILELYRPIEKKINCPIYAFAGEEDSEVPLDLVVKMKKYTENFHIQLFEGNHFFINSAVEEIISQICKVIVRNDS